MITTYQFYVLCLCDLSLLDRQCYYTTPMLRLAGIRWSLKATISAKRMYSCKNIYLSISRGIHSLLPVSGSYGRGKIGSVPPFPPVLNDHPFIRFFLSFSISFS